VSGIRRLSTKCWLGTLVRTLRRTDRKRRARDSRQSSRHHCHLPVVSFIWPNVSGQLGHTINLCERPNLMRSSSADGIAEPRLPPIHPIPMLASSWRPPRVISVVPVAVSLEVEMLQAKRKSPQRVDPKRRMACSGTRASHRWRRASASSKLVVRRPNELRRGPHTGASVLVSSSVYSQFDSPLIREASARSYPRRVLPSGGRSGTVCSSQTAAWIAIGEST
jgi:hypothetical protein